jgi:hypothetical protein
MDIDGEIQDIGTDSLSFIKDSVTFYEKSNSVLGSDFAYTEPTTLGLDKQCNSSFAQDLATITCE